MKERLWKKDCESVWKLFWWDFWLILIIFSHFCEIEKNALRTHGPTDPRTDGRTDKPSYRDAWTHLKTYPIYVTWIYCPGSTVALQCLHLYRAEQKQDQQKNFVHFGHILGSETSSWQMTHFKWSIVRLSVLVYYRNRSICIKAMEW